MLVIASYLLDYNILDSALSLADKRASVIIWLPLNWLVVNKPVFIHNVPYLGKH